MMLLPSPSISPHPVMLVTDLYILDDALTRLAQSLQNHGHCDIIDVNPGVGLWSTKLHEFIKPRTHVLMEPEWKFYSRWLQPLLDQKDSKYVLARYPGIK